MHGAPSFNKSNSYFKVFDIGPVNKIYRLILNKPVTYSSSRDKQWPFGDNIYESVTPATGKIMKIYEFNFDWSWDEKYSADVTETPYRTVQLIFDAKGKSKLGKV